MKCQASALSRRSVFAGCEVIPDTEILRHHLVRSVFSYSRLTTVSKPTRVSPSPFDVTALTEFLTKIEQADCDRTACHTSDLWNRRRNRSAPGQYVVGHGHQRASCSVLVRGEIVMSFVV